MQWRTRPLFVSSTFKDFQAERDVLQDLVFPELAERLRERRYDFEPIDLRLGVETASEADEARKTLLILNVCLQEVRRSRPFLLAMVGDYYGWVPPAERAERATAESGLGEIGFAEISDVSGKSVTQLEVEAGLGDPGGAGPVRMFAYFRDLDLDSVPGPHRGRYLGADRERVAAFKAGLRERLGSERCRTYPATWDPARERIGGLEEFRRLVLRDLWSDLEAETAQHLVLVESWRDRQREALQAFVHDTTRDFTGREALLDELSSLPRSDPELQGVCVTGEPGSGKSSVAAELIRRLQADPSLVLLAHAAGIEGESVRTDRVLQRWCGELAERLPAVDPPPDELIGEELERAFARLLGQVSSDRRTVIVVDALNEFERTPRSRQLTWLPALWPPNAVLVATATPGPEVEAFGHRPGFRVVELEPLLDSEAGRIVDGVYRRYRRQPNPDVKRAIVAKRSRGGEAAAGNPLWLELACEEMNLLDPEEFARAGGFEGAPDLQLVRLQLELVDQLPGTAQGIYRRMLRRAEQVAATVIEEERLSSEPGAARDWVRCLGELIAISRNGWRERDLQSLLESMTAVAWSELLFASVRRAFRGHLIQRGSSGLWTFYHQELRHGVRRHFGSPDAYLKDLHAAAAGHLEALPADNPLRQTERMHHLIGSDNQAGAAVLYADTPLGSEELRAQTESLAELFRARDDALDWVGRLLDVPQLTAPQRLGLGEKLMYPLHDALARESRVPERRALLSLVRERTRDAAAELPPGPERDVHSRQHAVSLLRLADLAFDSGDAVSAEELYTEYADHAEAAAVTSLARYVSGLDRCVALERLGDLAQRRGDGAQARRSFQSEVDVAGALSRAAPEDRELLVQLASAQERLGQLMLAEGDMAGTGPLAEAARLHDRLATGSDPAGVRRALAIRARLAELNEDLVQARDLLERYEALLHERARSSPEDVEIQVEWATGLLQVGDLALAAGDLGGAGRVFEQARALFARLAARIPDNLGLRRDWSLALEKVGDVALREGDLAGAHRIYTQNLQLREELSATRPNDVQARRDLGLAHERLGQVDDQPAQTRVDHLEQAIAIYAELQAIAPENETASRTLALGHFALAQALSGIPGRGEEAIEQAGRAHELLSELRAAGRRIEPEAQRVLAFLDTKFGGSGRWTHPVAAEEEDAYAELNLEAMLGVQALAARDYRTAERSFRRGLELARRIDHPPSIVKAAGSLGEVRAAVGDAGGALELLNEAVELAREHDLPLEEGQTQQRLAELYARVLNQPDRAVRAYRESMELAARAGNRRGWAISSAGLGVLHFERRQSAQAVDRLAEAAEAFEENHMRDELALALSYLGVAYQSLGDASGAIEAYQRHVALSRELGDPAAAAGSMANLSGVLWATGRREEAISVGEEASRYLAGPQADALRARVQSWRRS